MLESNFYYIRS